jgi:hypothetical protein
MLRRFGFPVVLAGLTLTTSFLASPQADTKTPPQQPQATPPLMMASDAKCDGMRELMIDSLVYQTVMGYGYGGYYGGYYGPRGGMDAEDSVARAPVAPTASQGAGGGEGGRAQPGTCNQTTTNVQERGFD